MEIVKLLLDRGADVNAPAGGHYGTALYAAACVYRDTTIHEDSLEIVQRLLDSGADVNATGGSYGSALGAAAARGKLDVVRLLLYNGADLNLTKGQGARPLELAEQQGHQDIVTLLRGLDGGDGLYLRYTVAVWPLDLVEWEMNLA